jgi:hypothetical protein
VAVPEIVTVGPRRRGLRRFEETLVRGCAGYARRHAGAAGARVGLARVQDGG